MTFESFLTGSALVAIGFIVIIINRILAESLPTPLFVSRFIGPGREESFYKLMGVLIILLGFMTIVGLHRYIIDLLVAPFRSLV